MARGAGGGMFLMTQEHLLGSCVYGAAPLRYEPRACGDGPCGDTLYNWHEEHTEEQGKEREKDRRKRKQQKDPKNISHVSA